MQYAMCSMYAHCGSLDQCLTSTPSVLILINMTSRQSLLQQDTYYRVMRLLEVNPDLSQRELASLLGVSVGGLNYCLKALVQKGWVKVQNFSNSKNKFGYVYLLTPSGVLEKADLTGHFLQRKMDEYEALRREIESLKAEVANGTEKI